MFLPSGILEHCYGFPKDLEGRSTSERLASFSYLQRRLTSRLVMSKIGNSLRCDLFILFAISCMISIPQSDIPILYFPRQNVPRASRMPSADTFPSG
jgi:hypothetical protein